SPSPSTPSSVGPQEGPSPNMALLSVSAPRHKHSPQRRWLRGSRRRLRRVLFPTRPCMDVEADLTSVSSTSAGESRRATLGASDFDPEAWLSTLDLADLTAEMRRRAASKGQALPGGGFPIRNEQDLRNAIQAVGRAKDP